MKVRETPAAESAEGSTNGIDEPVIVQFVKDNK